MNKKRFFTSILIGVLMICITNIKNTSYAKAIATPAPVVSGFSTSYMFGDKITLNLTSTSVTKLVQYKAVLTNTNSMEVQDLTKGYTLKYYNPKYKYPLVFTPNSAGRYRLVITSKLGGYKESYSKSITKEFTVWSDAMIINRIDTTVVKTNIDEDFIFPTTVTAIMKDGSKKEYNVKWDNEGFKENLLSEQVFFGTVNGYNQKVKIIVNVVDEKIISIDPITHTINEGNEYKLPEKVTGKTKNGTIQASVKWNEGSVDTNKPGTYKYEGIVAGYDGKVNLILTVNPVKLSLETINVSNLKEIQLKFNKKLDVSLINKDNFKLFRNSVLIDMNAELNRDDRTVVLSVVGVNSSLENKGRYLLGIEGVKDLNGYEIEKIIKDIMPEDNKRPEVLNITASGPYNILIEFSEPIKNTTGKTVEIRLSNGMVSANPILSGFETNRISIGLPAAMVENGIYEVVIKGFADYAGNQADAKAYPVKYNKNIEPITAKVEKVDPAWVAISFNKPVRGLTKDSFYYGDSAKKAIGIFSDSKMIKTVAPSQTLDMVWVKFYDSQFKTGNTIGEVEKNLCIISKAAGYEMLDSWGNPFIDTTIPIKAEWDKSTPKVLELTNDTEGSFILQFSENVKFGLQNIEVSDEKEGKLNIAIKQNSNNRYTIELGKDYIGHKITISLKDVEDDAVVPNKLTSHTSTIIVTDKTAPMVKSVSKRLVTGLDNSLYVIFNEAVNDTALDIANYYIQNPMSYTMTGLTEKPVFYEGKKIVRISLSDKEKSLINSGYDMFVRDVEDLYGNKLLGQTIKNTNIISFDSNDNRPKIIRLEAISKNELKITFNQILKVVDKSAFMLNGKAPKIYSLAEDSEGNSVITLTADDSSPFSSGLEGASLVILADATKSVENLFGLGVSSSVHTSTSYPVKIEDKMVPGVMTIYGVPQIYALRGPNGVLDTIAILYEENIDTTKLSALSYNVKGRDIARVYTNIYPQKGTSLTGRYVIIELKPIINTSGSYVKGTLTQVLDVYDMQGNKLSPNGVWMDTIN